MIRKLAILLSCFCVTLIANAGGMPSRPKFQNTTVNGVATTTVPNLLVQGSGAQSEQRATDAAANAKRWNWASTTTQYTLRTLNDAGNAGSNGLSFTRSGYPLTQIDIGNATDNPAVTVNGRALPKFTYAWLNGSSSCALQTGTQSQNFASCSHPSTGNFVVTFTSAYTTNPPVCVANAIDTITIGSVTAATTTTVTVTVFRRDTGVAADQVLTVQCMGT
jgi:hypothetical protein